MPVLLVVTPSTEGSLITAMVWSADDEDPRLLDSRQFRGEGAFKIWLGGVVVRYGRSNIRVSPTEALSTDARLRWTIEEVIGAAPLSTSSPAAAGRAKE
jgi:hypothetical protein